MSNIAAFKNLPDVDFINTTIEELLADMINDYEQAYYESTGEKKTLAQGDPVRIWIYAQALKLYMCLKKIDYSAKQNLLKYSEGDILHNIGARIGVTRLPAQKAVTTIRFTLSAVQANDVVIPLGTRATPGNNIYFETTSAGNITAGNLYVDIEAEAIEAGSSGNGYTPGQINILVDPIQYIQSISNVDITQGGAEIESDDSLTERIYLKPESFSVAGPDEAYIFFTRQFNQSIIDVVPTSPNPGEVNIRFILTDGEIPSETLINELHAYLSDKKKRPLTDYVTVEAPTQIDYTIDLTYYLRLSDQIYSDTIQANITAAVESYRIWQKSKISRDISPDELLYMVKAAGAKRVVITSPVFTDLAETEVANDISVNIVFGGYENE